MQFTKAKKPQGNESLYQIIGTIQNKIPTHKKSKIIALTRGQAEICKAHSLNLNYVLNSKPCHVSKF